MLTTHVANKIAAGEVVERPASVLKELLENSLDAGATRVDVAATAGGRKLISVADNGCGMNRDDALMAPERQATSKIQDVDDIEKIDTFGFRGEALASIAAVSRFTLCTRRQGDDCGTEITIAGGRMLDVKDCGCPAGTLIEVRDLFFNVPARRNFLRAFQTEQAHIRNIFVLHAVANPGVAMSLKLDGDLVHQLAPCENLLDRIRELFGAEEADVLLGVDHSAGRIRVFGYAGVPAFSRNDRGGQRVYVNRRPATAATVQAAISAAYPRMDGERKPVVFLFIDLPPEQVDVNVHPTKREVRFRNNFEVRDAVIAALRKALGAASEDGALGGAAFGGSVGNGIGSGIGSGGESGAFDENGFHSAPCSTPFNMPPCASPYSAPYSPHNAPHNAPPPIPRRFDFPPHNPSETRSFGAGFGAGFGTGFGAGSNRVAATPGFSPADASGAAAGDSDAPDEAFVSAPSGAPWARFRVVGRLAPGFVLLETDDGLVVLDPSAAHERVIYERLVGKLDADGARAASQPLLFPQTVEMAPLDFRRIEAVLPELRELGFGIDPLEKKAFLIDALPGIVSAAPCREILLDIAEAFEQAGPRRGKEKLHEELIAKAASKAAVRVAGALSGAALCAIISDLVRCEMPYASPAGRATMHLVSFNELNRRFGR